ncbi:MAG: substrate-binding domain-containing protein [candidate division KSB1 bacterium]|nr:substrate-binding domain-containing protein [candidate division KSB1 bacterium]
MGKLFPLSIILGVFMLTSFCAGRREIEIALIPKGTDILFWKAVHAGGEKAAQDYGVKVIWQGPQKESDREQQINIVQNFISRGVSAIVLAPLDETALIRPVQAALKRNIPVVIIDSGLKGEGYASFIATNNYASGQLAAQKLVEMLGGSGKVILMRFNEGSNSTHEREEGFLAWLRENAPKITILSSDQYAGVTIELALKTGQNLLNRYTDVDGIFCPNESTTFGMLRALKTVGKAGKVKLVGFDYTEPIAEAIRVREISGVVVQDPFGIGYRGVEAAVKVLRGEKVPARVETQVVFVTAENIDDPVVKAVTSPDIDKWLAGK